MKGGAKRWRSDYVNIFVHFDGAECVDEWYFVPVRPENESPLNLLRRCLRPLLRL
jgi:hypothetical protein